MIGKNINLQVWDDYISKPIDKEELRKVLDKWSTKILKERKTEKNKQKNKTK